MEGDSIGTEECQWDNDNLDFLLESIDARDILRNDFEDQVEPFDIAESQHHNGEHRTVNHVKTEQPEQYGNHSMNHHNLGHDSQDSGIQDLPFKSSNSSPYHCSSPNSSNSSPPPQYSPHQRRSHPSNQRLDNNVVVHTGNGSLGEEVQIQFSDKSQVQNQVPVSVFKNGEKIFIIQGTPSQVTTPPQGGTSDCGMPLSPENMSTNQNQTPKKKKVERNKAHNVIEKRYRHSINDRIETLKSLLGGRESKLSKSAVLRLAIDEIERNRKKVQTLEEEIKKLKDQSYSGTPSSGGPGSSILRGILNPNRQSSQDSVLDSEIGPDGSEMRSSQKMVVNDMGYTTQGFIEKGYAGRARSDMSRMLYSFVAIFMLFIPVSQFLNLDAESYLNSNLNQILDSNPDQSDAVHFEGRKLQSYEEPVNEDFDSTTLKLVNWSLNIMTYTFFNCVIFFYLMYRVLVQMEPTTALHSSESKQYDVTYQKGVDAFEKYELSKSKLEMTACLDILGRFHAKSRLDGIVSVIWSVLVKVTNKSGIKWFVCCLASKLQSADHLQSAKMASMAYYMLAKIEFAIMTQYDSTKASRWSLFSYVSHSVLLLEGATDKFTSDEACRIYLQAAIVYERFMPKWMSGFVVKRLTTKAIMAAKKHSIQGELIWLTDPIGEEFLNEYGFTEIEADFSAKTMTLCKIKLLSKSFRSYLIDKIAKKCANRYSNDSVALIELVMLLQNCSKNENEIIDPVSFWWTACCFLIMHENGEHQVSKTMKAELQIILENVPKAMNPEFHECVNPAQQLGVVFYCFYKVCAEELPFDCALGSLFVMNETLAKSFETSKFDQNRMQKRIGLNMAAFGADSILWATCELYKKNKDKFDDERMGMLIESCEANLALYGAILDSLPKSINRYSMWEAFLKKIKNSNPTEIYDSIRKFKTQRELKSNRCANHSDSEGDDPSICRQAFLEGEKLMTDTLPDQFVEKDWTNRYIQSDKGIT